MSKGGRLRRARALRASGGLPLMDRYLTAGDVAGEVPDRDTALRCLGRVPVERALDWVARLLAPSGSGDWLAYQHGLARVWFARTPGGRRARDLVLRGERRLLAPHLLLWMARLALVHGSRAPAGDHETPRGLAAQERDLRMAMLVLAQHAGTERRGRDDALRDDRGALALDGKAITGLELEMAANLRSNHRPFPASVFDRSERRWLEIPREEAGGRGVVDLAAGFQAATGVPLQDLRSVTLALWARAGGDDGPRCGPGHLDGLGLGRERLDRVLALLSADVGGLAAGAALEDGEYQSSVFEDSPVVRLANGGLLVMSPLLLVERGVGWLPTGDLRDGLEAQGEAGRKRAERALGYLRMTTQRHATETLAAGAGAASPSGVLYDDTAIQRAYGTAARSADCAVRWPGEWVVAEVSARVVNPATAGGLSTRALLTDLIRGVVQKAEQLHRTIAAIRADEGRLTGRPADDGPRRFFPVLVITEGFPVTTLTTRRVRRMLAAAGLLQDDDTAPLVIVDTEALEAVESVAERGGPALPALLAAHAASPMADYGFREWLLMEHRGLRPPTRVMDRWDRVFEPLLRSLPQDG